MTDYKLFTLRGCFQLPKLRHGGGGRIFAFLVLDATLGFGRIVILGHESSPVGDRIIVADELGFAAIPASPRYD